MSDWPWPWRPIRKTGRLRTKLAATRRAAPLFRTAAFVRQLESGFDEA